MNPKRRDLKIIFHSDAIWTQSGYSVETDWLVRRLLLEGFPVAQASKAGLGGHWIDYTLPEGIVRMYPSVNDPHGSDAMFFGARHWGANVAISMIDIWVIPPEWINHLHEIGCKWWAYMPVDSNPVSPNVLRNLPLADKIITFSKFGQEQLKKEGFVAEMIYEGVDTNFLKPMDKVEARKKAGFPENAFIWGMIAANKENPPRKAFQECMEAFKVFNQNHPDSYLFIGTQQISPASFPIHDYATYLGIRDKIIIPDQLFMSILATREDIRFWMNAFDALLHPSATEGFGLTIVEAQSIGKPVVINKAHSMPELIVEGKTGFTAIPDRKWWTNANSYWEQPQPMSIYLAMQNVFNLLREKGAQVAIDCRNNVLENFDIDTIFKERWLPTFEKLQDEMLKV